MAERSRRWLTRLAIFLVTAVLGGGCDLRSKEWAEETLTQAPGWTMQLVAPYLELALSYNRGSAFSLVGDFGGEARWILGALALALVAVLAFAAARGQGTLTAIALGCIAGGAIGNGLDRLFHLAPGGGTGVVDFIRINYPWGGSWPTFNIADALVAIGVALYFVALNRRRGHAREPVAEAS
ncbi:MAG: signal peptidase II [Sandaracinaceae bacterium]